MSLRSIPPVERGVVKGRGSSQARTFTRPRTALGFKTSASPIRRELSQPIAVFPSVRDVKVSRTPNGATWGFPHGEFEVMIESEEVHVEVRIGGFSDALIIKTRKEE